MWRCGGWYQDQLRYYELNVIARHSEFIMSSAAGWLADNRARVRVCSASDDFNAKTENRDQLRIQIAEEIKSQGHI